MASASSNLNAILKTYEDKFDAFLEKIKAVKLLSHEVTKFSLAFEKPPAPSGDECRSLANEIECAVENLVTLFVNFPISRGKFLHEEMNRFLVRILLGLKELFVAARSPGCSVLQKVGYVWEKCELVDQLPKDEKEVVLAMCESEHSLVNDAVFELTDAVENGTEDDAEMELRHAFMQNGIRIQYPTRWSESDRRVVMASLGLIKVCRTCLKKTSATIRDKARATDESSIAELDQIAEIFKSCSYVVDELASSLYPPVYHSAVTDHAASVRTTCRDLLTCLENCSQLVSEAEMTWINFLHRALDHNWQQINERIAPQ